LSHCLAPAALAPGLVGSTVEAAACLATGQAARAAAVSDNVVALTEGALKTMFASRLKTALAALVLLAAVAVGAGGLLYQMQAAEPQQPPRAARPAAREGDRPQAAPRPLLMKIDGAWLGRVAWSADGKTVVSSGHTTEVVELKDSGDKVLVSSHALKLWDA